MLLTFFVLLDFFSPPPSPHLMVEPSSGHVKPGETLSFHCQAPPEHQKHPPETFLLVQKAKGTPGSMVAPAKLVSQSLEAHFSVKTMGREDSGEYVCLYQLKLPKTGQVNSTASQPVHITVIGEEKTVRLVLYSDYISSHKNLIEQLRQVLILIYVLHFPVSCLLRQNFKAL